MAVNLQTADPALLNQTVTLLPGNSALTGQQVISPFVLELDPRLANSAIVEVIGTGSITVQVVDSYSKGAGFSATVDTQGNFGTITSTKKRLITGVRSKVTVQYTISSGSWQIVATPVQAVTQDPINVTATIGGTLEVDILSVGGTTITLGQKVMASSFPVTIASDQTGFAVTEANLDAALVAPESTVAVTKGLAILGLTNDGTPAYEELPLGADGRSVIIEGFAGGTAIPVTGTFTDANLDAALVAPESTVATTKALVILGLTNDGTPAFEELPLGADGRSVIIEGFAGSQAVPTTGFQNAALLLAANNVIGSATTTTNVSLGSLAEAAVGSQSTIFDAKSVTLIITNTTAQAINAANLVFKDTVNGLAASVSYALPSVNVPATTGVQTFEITLNNGVLLNLEVDCTFASSVSAGRVDVKATVRGAGSANVNLGLGLDLTDDQVGTLPVAATTSTPTNVSLTTTVATILASNTNRRGAVIANDTGSANTALVHLGSGASSTQYGYAILPGGSIEVPFGWTGIVTGICAAGTATARVTELTA